MVSVPAVRVERDVFMVELSPITEDIVFNDGVKLYFGTDKDAYFTWNNADQRFELWIGGIKKAQWGN